MLFIFYLSNQFSGKLPVKPKAWRMSIRMSISFLLPCPSQMLRSLPPVPVTYFQKPCSASWGPIPTPREIMCGNSLRIRQLALGFFSFERGKLAQRRVIISNVISRPLSLLLTPCMMWLTPSLSVRKQDTQQRGLWVCWWPPSVLTVIVKNNGIMFTESYPVPVSLSTEGALCWFQSLCVYQQLRLHHSETVTFGNWSKPTIHLIFFKSNFQ